MTQLQRGYRIIDYDLHTLQLHERPAASYAVLLLAAVMRLNEAAVAATCTNAAAAPKARADATACRLIALIVSLQVGLRLPPPSADTRWRSRVRLSTLRYMSQPLLTFIELLCPSPLPNPFLHSWACRVHTQPPAPLT